MYKLMIVEDEPTIRAGLKHYFNWDELKVTEIVEAENGLEGIGMALKELPDLIVTDIRMPEIDGLQMIEELRSRLPDTLFVILSGYNDFSFAQRAIRLGQIHAYLLKPLEYEESLASLQECIRRLDDKRLEREQRSRLERTVKEAAKLQQEGPLKLIIEEKAALTTERLQQLCGYPADKYIVIPFAAALFPKRGAHADWRTLVEELIRDLQTAASSNGKNEWHVFTYNRMPKLYGIAVADAGRCDAAALTAALSSALDKSLAKPRWSAYGAVGAAIDHFADAGERLRSTEKALYLRYSGRGGRLFHIREGTASGGLQEQAGLSILIEEHLVLECLASGDSARTQAFMNGLAEQAKPKLPHMPSDQWLAFLQQLINVTLRFAHRSGITVEGVYSDKLLTLSFVDEFENAEELFGWLTGWMLQLSADYAAKGQSSPVNDSLVFEKIAAYIKRNIQEDITLQMVADQFFYNPSYLSRLFKSKLNKNYMAFVTEIRIRSAQQFLKDPGYLITDVCQLCGYKSYKHFVKMFRSVTNMTPTDYRKQLGM